MALTRLRIWGSGVRISPGAPFPFGRINNRALVPIPPLIAAWLGAVSADWGTRPFARPGKRTARTDLSESPLVLTGFCPRVGHGCQNHLEQYQGFVSGSNPATPTS